MTDYYPALIRKDTGSDFGVEFPDLPGCVTSGTTIDGALRLAEEALRLHVDGIVEDGEAVPPPSPIERVLEVGIAQAAAIYLVRLLPAKGRAVRVNVTLDEHLLEEIDIEAAERHMTRSGFIAEAARSVIEVARDERLGREISGGSGRVIDRRRRFDVSETKRRMRAGLSQPPDTSSR